MARTLLRYTIRGPLATKLREKVDMKFRSPQKLPLQHTAESQSLAISGLLRARPSQRGSTLIELMVGLAVLAVLAGLAVPGIASVIRQYNVRTAADDLVFGVNLARSQAASNRRAYGLALGNQNGTVGLKFSVIRGSGTACSTIAGGKVVYSADYSADNPVGSATVVVTAYAPAEIASATSVLCFKPDGRLLRADTALPFSAPIGSLLGAGDVIVELRRANAGAVAGTALQVSVGYNGTARVTFGKPLAALQGGGG